MRFCVEIAAKPNDEMATPFELKFSDFFFLFKNRDCDILHKNQNYVVGLAQDGSQAIRSTNDMK